MVKRLLAISLILLSSSSFAARDLGVGVMVGHPTGLSLKKWLGENRAVDGGFGMSFGRQSRASLHSDYLLHEKGALFFNDIHPLDLYYGIGGRMKFDDDIRLGARVPVGLVYNWDDHNADMFGEVAPIVDFLGKTGLDLNLVIGARLYF